jgi:hypothetical protein
VGDASILPRWRGGIRIGRRRDRGVRRVLLVHLVWWNIFLVGGLFANDGVVAVADHEADVVD